MQFTQKRSQKFPITEEVIKEAKHLQLNVSFKLDISDDAPSSSSQPSLSSLLSLSE